MTIGLIDNITVILTLPGFGLQVFMSDNVIMERNRIQKIRTGEDVLSAVTGRVEWIFNTFSQVCLSFSGGKDSTVLFHIVATIARRKHRRFSVLFIDWEAQYQSTIEHVQKMKDLYSDVTETFFWVALPLTTVNGVSQFQPEWICWEPDMEWVRQPPADAITDMAYFPFYRYAMTFEEFVPAFSTWFTGNQCGVAILTGVRADESLNRFIGLTSQRKLRYADDKPWTTASPEGFYYTMCPLYDWKARDIWIYHARTGAIHNPLYDLMYRAGVPLRNMRVCEPFGPEQRRGLWLYHVLEPETWARMCARVPVCPARPAGPFMLMKVALILPCVNASPDQHIIPGAAMPCFFSMSCHRKQPSITGTR